MHKLAAVGKTEDEARNIVLNGLWDRLITSRSLPHTSELSRAFLIEYCDFLYYGN